MNNMLASTDSTLTVLQKLCHIFGLSNIWFIAPLFFLVVNAMHFVIVSPMHSTRLAYHTIAPSSSFESDPGGGGPW